VYNPEWESNAVYQTWIRPFKADKTKAICSVCDKIIDISNMGEAALKSHTKAEKHNRSLNSAASNNPLKISAFPDSQIAAKFSCGDRKTAYLCVFGIREYLKELLVTGLYTHFLHKQGKFI
jgi:hypothetical protein